MQNCTVKPPHIKMKQIETRPLPACVKPKNLKMVLKPAIPPSMCCAFPCFCSRADILMKQWLDFKNSLMARKSAFYAGFPKEPISQKNAHACGLCRYLCRYEYTCKREGFADRAKEFQSIATDHKEEHQRIFNAKKCR